MKKGSSKQSHKQTRGLGATSPRTFLSMRRRLDSLAGMLNELEHGIDNPPERDICRFIEKLKIVDKAGRLVSLIVNPAQEIVLYKLLAARENHVPARFICCKSRQMGISTLIKAYIFALLALNPNRSALVAAHSVESASTMFACARRFYRSYAKSRSFKPALNARRIVFPAPSNSVMRIDTASNRNLGRGATLSYVHAGETAFWENAEDPMLAISQAVPQHWDTLLFVESTANGAHNLFHRMWIAAERGESEFEPIFLSWKTFPEYSMPAAPGERLETSPAEAEYSRNHKLTLGQMKWAMFTKRNQCQDSWDKFHQEYPVVAGLAFNSSGHPWFDPAVIQHMLDNAATAEARGYLTFGERDLPRFHSDDAGPLWVWEYPDPAASYSLGMDVGEGVGADYTVIQVIRNDTRLVVAKYSSNRVRAETAGVEAYLLGAWYNYGLLAIERNGPGLAALTVCERGMADRHGVGAYPNLYYHTFTDRKIPEETHRLGWITNKVTKEAMLVGLSETVAQGGIMIKSKRTLIEMQGFVWDSEKRRWRQNYRAPGSKLTHDDEIMALALANEMRSHAFKSVFIPGVLPRGNF